MKFKIGDKVYYKDMENRLGTITSVNDFGHPWVEWEDELGSIPYYKWLIVHCDYHNDFLEKIKDRML